MRIVSLILGLSAFYILMRTLLSRPEAEVSVVSRFSQGLSRKRTPWYALLLRILSPLNRFLLPSKLKEKISFKLEGARILLSPEEFLGIQEIVSLVGTGFIYFLFQDKIPFLGYAFVFSVLFFFPYFYLVKRWNQRRGQIIRFLPETIDILGLCISAGLDFVGASHWVIAKSRTNPFIEELKKVIDEISLGKSKTEALRAMSRRLNIPDVSSFARTLIQAERMGTPVSEAFGILTEDVRIRRFQRGERIALQAPLKMLVPLIFCILPVIAIIIGAPILLQFMKGTSGLGGLGF